MELTGPHSNPSRALKAVLYWASASHAGLDGATDRPAQARPERGTPPIGAAHPRHDWVLSAVIQVFFFALMIRTHVHGYIGVYSDGAGPRTGPETTDQFLRVRAGLGEGRCVLIERAEIVGS
jgi:hypothetical protein